MAPEIQNSRTDPASPRQASYLPGRGCECSIAADEITTILPGAQKIDGMGARHAWAVYGEQVLDPTACQYAKYLTRDQMAAYSKPMMSGVFSKEQHAAFIKAAESGIENIDAGMKGGGS